MNDKIFEELKQSLKEAVAISRGEMKASRRFALTEKARPELVSKSPKIS